MNFDRQHRRQPVDTFLEATIYENRSSRPDDDETGADIGSGFHLDLRSITKPLPHGRCQLCGTTHHGAFAIDEFESPCELAPQGRQVGLASSGFGKKTPGSFEHAIDHARLGEQHGAHRRVAFGGNRNTSLPPVLRFFAL